MLNGKYLTLAQVASLMGLATKTLRNWKYSDPHKLPPHVVIKSGSRDLLRFNQAEVEAWLHNAR